MNNKNDISSYKIPKFIKDNLKDTKMVLDKNNIGRLLYKDVDINIKMKPDNLSKYLDIYNSFRKAIYNNYIPVWKPIGFSTITHRADGKTIKEDIITERCLSLLENPFVIASNVINLLGYNMGNHIYEELVITLDEADNVDINAFDINGVNSDKIVNNKQHICTAISGFQIAIMFIKYQGVLTIDESSKLINELLEPSRQIGISREYFPLNQIFSLAPLIDVFPLVIDESVNVKFRVNKDICIDKFINIYNDFARSCCG